MTESINPNIKKAEDFFKVIVWDNVLNTQLTALMAANPWLNIWPIRPIVMGLANYFSSKIYESLRLFVDLNFVKFMNDSDRASFDRASVELYSLAKNKGIDSNEYKEARKTHKEKFKNLVMFRAA